MASLVQRVQQNAFWWCLRRTRMRSAAMMGCLLAVLAGCTSSTDAPVVDAAPCVVESADDYSCAQQQNRAPDQVAHVHDYWGGRDVVRLLEETQSLGYQVVSSCEPDKVRVWLPPEEATVFQGTGRVDVTTGVEYEPDHASGPLQIWVKRADQDSPEYVADLEDGATVTMQVDHSAADLPHQVLSAWEFWVYAEPHPALDAYCMVQPRATVTMEVDIHKTLEVLPFPGHPDHWGGAEELPLLDAFAQVRVAEEWLGACIEDDSSHPEGSCEMHRHGFGPLDGHVVPPGAGVVRLTLTADPAAGQPPTQLGLRYHGAHTRTFEHVEPVSRQGDLAEYEIEVAGDNDGPYAKQSQWRFQVVNESDHQTFQGEWGLGGVVRAG